MAVKHLYNCGYRSIGYLHSSLDFRCFKKREQGVLAAIDDFKMDCPLVLTMPSRISDAREYMSCWLKDKKPIPRAFFADNDNTALGAMSAFENAGYKIPEDISLIGMDDIVYSSFASVPLTTIHISRRQLAKSALDALRWNVSSQSIHIVCRGRIVLRDSTRMFDSKTESTFV